MNDSALANAPDQTPDGSIPQSVAIVGVGLIGGSIAAALKKRRLCGRTSEWAARSPGCRPPATPG